MNITKFENEDAIDLIANVIEPISKIAQDKTLINAIKKDDKMKAVQILLKKHKKEIIEVLAALHGEPVDTFKCNVLTITQDLIELLNNTELIEVFTS